MLRQRLTLGRPVTCIDATNLTPRERRAYVRMGELLGAEVEAIFLSRFSMISRRDDPKATRIPSSCVLRFTAYDMTP
jgi:predicted kinase